MESKHTKEISKELKKWLNSHCSTNQKVTYNMCNKFVTEYNITSIDGMINGAARKAVFECSNIAMPKEHYSL